MAGVEQEASLEAGAIGLFDALVIGLAATSPAYSLAVGLSRRPVLCVPLAE